MAIEGTIQSTLGALVSGRCYPLVNTATTIVKPYIIYQVVSNVPEVGLGGANGTERRRMQIDIFADSYGAAKTIESSVKSTMTVASFVTIPLGSQELYEDETKLYRVMMEYAVWT